LELGTKKQKFSCFTRYHPARIWTQHLNLRHLCQFGQIMSGRHFNDCELPEGETDRDIDYGDILNGQNAYKHWHRAVRDMMTGNKQVQYNCGSARGSKTFTCHSE